MWNIQKIYDDGQKRFFKGARKKGCFHLLQGLDEQTFVFAEGYATGLSLHKATGQSVVVCFDAGNIEPVVKAFRDRYPESNLIIAGDNDIYGPVNTGHKYAREAGNRYDCKVILPAFKDAHTKPTDFNDLACLEGLEAVRDQLNPCFAKTHLKAITALNFVNRLIHPRQLIMSPFLPTQGLCMIYAPRGMGKTYLTLSIAFSIAQGEPLLPGRWHCDRSHRVLYVDGEMCQFDLQERIEN
jgi:putative DNA primase/helicase